MLILLMEKWLTYMAKKSSLSLPLSLCVREREGGRERDREMEGWISGNSSVSLGKKSTCV